MKQVRAVEHIWDEGRSRLVAPGTAMTLLYEDKETVRVLIGRDELDVLPWLVADAPGTEAPDPLPIPTFVGVVVRDPRGLETILAGSSESHSDEEEIPYTALRVGETMAEAAERATWELGVTTEPGDTLVDYIGPGSGGRSERRVLIAARPKSAWTPDGIYLRPESLARGRFGFAIDRVMAWLEPAADATPGDAPAAEADADAEEGPQPPWIQCDHCENFLCTIHGMHVHDCPCPPIEEWTTDPYSDVLA
jgi:hypothetical protein